MKRTVIALVAAILIMAPTFANAAGFRLVETDNGGQGMAHAVTASVNDASAVYYNPAALTSLDGYAAKAGVQIVDPMTEYTGNGTSLKTANTSFAVPSVYVAKTWKDKGLAVGLGMFSNFGLGTTWANDSVFRYVTTDSQLRTATYNLNVAKSFGDMFSAAIGVDYMTTDATLSAMYPFSAFEAGAADGYRIMKGTGNGVGFNAAIMLKPMDSLKIGLTYRSQIKTTVSGNVEIKSFPSTLGGLVGGTGNSFKTSADMDITYPDIIVLGIAYMPTDKLTLEIDGDYTNWSTYDQLKVKAASGLGSVYPASATTKKDWDSVTAIRVGGAYKIMPTTSLRVGYYFDPTPVPEKTFDPNVPDNTRNAVTFGLGYKATDRFSVDMAYGYIWTDTRSVNNDVGSGAVDGDYKTYTHIFGISAGYQF